MSNIRWLSPTDPPEAFPPATDALADPNGLLAAGGDLEPERLLTAYVRGIFPWYESGQPILWWSPDPRSVLWPHELRISRSLRKTLSKRRFDLSADTAFERVVDGCAAPRGYQGATWITPEMAQAYARLHRLGWAHSFESWQDGELAGGLYGVAVGRVFFGESMFSRVNDASKVALTEAVRYLRIRGFELIDCQLPSSHLESLGSRSLPRDVFLTHLARLCEPRGRPGPWSRDFTAARGQSMAEHAPAPANVNRSDPGCGVE